jgi:glycerol-3-phosphate O-acyltransferase/dihydroxyacetone phosphate acyltransferase
MPNRETLGAAKMARHLLFADDRNIRLSDFRDVAQTLVDLFSPSSSSCPAELKQLLLRHHALLRSHSLSSSSLGPVPLPPSLDPNASVPLPNRVSTLFALLRASVRSLARLPFFAFPLAVHTPIYVAGKLASYATNVEEEESFAQNKIVVGLLLLALVVYPTLFVLVWALFLLSPFGAVAAGAFVWLFAVYHTKSVDANYRAAKRLRACWKIVWGVWTGRKETGELLETRVRATKDLVRWLAGLEGGPEGDKVRLLMDKGAWLGSLVERRVPTATAAKGEDEVDDVVQGKEAWQDD